jgi:hypothetical protein
MARRGFDTSIGYPGHKVIPHCAPKTLHNRDLMRGLVLLGHSNAHSNATSNERMVLLTCTLSVQQEKDLS